MHKQKWQMGKRGARKTIDIVLCSECACIVYFSELATLFEEAFEAKDGNHTQGMWRWVLEVLEALLLSLYENLELWFCQNRNLNTTFGSRTCLCHTAVSLRTTPSSKGMEWWKLTNHNSCIHIVETSRGMEMALYMENCC